MSSRTRAGKGGLSLLQSFGLNNSNIPSFLLFVADRHSSRQRSSVLNVSPQCESHEIMWIVLCHAGAVLTNTANLTPFAPFGFNGIFRGASMVFFAYLGFEVRQLAGHIPSAPNSPLCSRSLAAGKLLKTYTYTQSCASAGLLSGTVRASRRSQFQQHLSLI